MKHDRHRNLGPRSPGALWGRTEPRAPEFLCGGGFRIGAADQSGAMSGQCTSKRARRCARYAGRAALSRAPSSTTRAYSGLNRFTSSGGGAFRSTMTRRRAVHSWL
jgi:hypothetical protein